MRAHVRLDPRGRHSLPPHFGNRFPPQAAPHALERLARLVAKWLLDRPLAHAADIGEPHAVGGQERRQRMNQHAGHTERIGDQTSVLATGAAKAIERVARHIVAALHGDLLDRVGHVLDRNLDEAIGDLFGAAPGADILCQGRKCAAHGVSVERLILLRPEDLRKEVGDELTDHHVGVCHGEWPAAAIAFRPRIGAGGVGPDAKARTVEVQDRTAAGRHRVDEHHRCAHAHAGDFGFERALIFAGEVRHISRGAAHVETDQIFEASGAAGLGHADHAGCRP
jgi:hypothetical protein